MEKQRDAWKAALGVEPGDIDTTPEEAVATARAAQPGTLPEAAWQEMHDALDAGPTDDEDGMPFTDIQTNAAMQVVQGWLGSWRFGSVRPVPAEAGDSTADETWTAAEALETLSESLLRKRDLVRNLHGSRAGGLEEAAGMARTLATYRPRPAFTYVAPSEYVPCRYVLFAGEGGGCIANAVDDGYCKPHADALRELESEASDV
jgi:hypothetical protein